MIRRPDRWLLRTLCLHCLAVCGACSQTWVFAPPERIRSADYAETERASVAQPPMDPAMPLQAVETTSVNQPAGETARGDDYAWMPERLTKKGLFQQSGCDGMEDGCGLRSRLREGRRLLRPKIVEDHRNFYCWPTGRDLLLGIAGGSLLANTSMDQDFQNWIQNDVRSPDADHFADFWKPFGDGRIFVPSLVGLGVAGWLLDDYPVCSTAGRFGIRASRAFLVGSPPMVFLQSALGGGRPGESTRGSAWQPFDYDSAVSGHAFIGAVPFITAAQMSESPCAAGCFYFLSVLPAWSRIEDDAHYLSQGALGWWMAYLACRSVTQTEMAFHEGTFRVAPVVAPDMAGFMATYEF